MSRHVEITKDGNNYIVNPNASGGGGLDVFQTVTVYNAQSDYGDDFYNYWLILKADGTPTTVENLQEATMVINGGTIGGSQRLYYIGEAPDVWASELNQVENFNSFTFDNPQEVPLLQLLCAGYYGG